MISTQVAAAFYGPAPSAFSVKAVADGVGDLMRRNDATGRLSLVGAATAFCACLRPRAAPVLALGALAALAVSNPALEVGKVDAALLVNAGVAASRTSATSILAAQPGHFRLHDFSLVSAVVHSPQESWTGQVLAVGTSVEINQCRGTGIATLLSRRRVDGVEDDRAVKF